MRRVPNSQEDRDRYAAAAAPEAIREKLKSARTQAAMAANLVSWLEVLLARRCQQIVNGEWPPKKAGND